MFGQASHLVNTGAEEVSPEVRKQLEEFKVQQKDHDFWNNKYFQACKAGSLTKDDFAYIFSQYFLYSRNFTRYLTAVMTNCESDYYRACLSANLWEEGGGIEPEKRHANIFRNFLVKTFNLDLLKLNFHEHTRYFYRNYLDKCIRNDATYGAAFLSLGTEGIVAPMYAIMVEGMKKAGIPDENLEFFYIHMACDDEHAETLEQMMASYSAQRGWYATCQRAMEEALSLRRDFFNALMGYVEQRKKQALPPDFHNTPPLLARLKRTDSILETPNPKPQATDKSIVLPNCTVGCIDFPEASKLKAVVDYLPKGHTSTIQLSTDSLLYIIDGHGRVDLSDGSGNSTQEIKAGDGIYIPPSALVVVESTHDCRFILTSANTKTAIKY